MSETRLRPGAYSRGHSDPVPQHRRNPRRAYDCDGREYQPMDLANTAQNGVKAIRAICPPPCWH